jgi:hypothetical protein
VPSFVGPELALLLGLELMGSEAVPVPIGSGAAALDREDVDLLLLRGASLTQGSPRERASRGWGHAFSLGMVSGDGRLARDPAFMEVPTVSELIERAQADRGSTDRAGTDRMAALSIALRSAAAAATLDVALVLPLLAPAAVVAWWRQGCTALASAPDVQEEAARSLTHMVEAGSMAASMTMITTEPPVLLELRRWLAERHQWRPG